MRSKLQQAGLVLTGLCAGVLISLNFPAQADKAALEPLPVSEVRALASVFNAIKQSYVEPVEDKTLITDAISGMVTGLDPHSAYLDSEAFKDLQVSTQGEFGGLGIEVGMEDGFVKVISPIEDTPAYRAGVQAGDLIVKLDDTPVKGMTLGEAVKQMRGKPGTDIILTIAREGEDKPVIITITRDVIHVQSVKSKMPEDGFGYVRITQFQESTARDLTKHLGRLYDQGPLKGLVLDLRNDPGGLLHGAVGVSATFLPKDVLVVSTDGRVEDAKREFKASPDDYLRGGNDFLRDLPAGVKDVPMVVLVNGGSASASEIVAGALQDHKRAKVLGTQTFGKGSVQTILPLSETTAIKLTTARYYTPSGRSIQAKGISPDYIVNDPNENGALRRVREADLVGHLSNDKDPGAEKLPVAKDLPATEDADEKAKEDMPFKRIEPASAEDFQFQQAMKLLKGEPIVQNTDKG